MFKSLACDTCPLAGESIPRVDLCFPESLSNIQVLECTVIEEKSLSNYTVTFLMKVNASEE